MITGLNATTNATGGLELHGGVQFDDIGIFAAPGIAAGGGGGFGLIVGCALLIDAGVSETVRLGGGPEVGWFLAAGTEDGLSAALYGGRTRLSFHPGRHDDLADRDGLAIGVDLRILAGNAGPMLEQADWDQPVADTSRFDAILWPTVFVGYEAF